MTVHISNPNSTFLHIPKCAGSSIRKWLIDNVPGSVSLKASHNTYEDLHRNKDLGMIFCVVRNPYDRVVSGFNYKRQKNPKEFNKEFKSFADYVHKGSDKTFIPQWQYAEKADIVLRYESLVEDFKQVQDYYKCYVDLPHTNKSSHDHWKTYYDELLLKQVHKKFQKDFELFNYPVDINDYQD